MIFGIVILKIIWIFGIRAFFSYFCDTQYSETITLKTQHNDNPKTTGNNRAKIV